LLLSIAIRVNNEHISEHMKMSGKLKVRIVEILVKLPS